MNLDYNPTVPMDSEQSAPFRVDVSGVGQAADRERVDYPDFIQSDYRKRKSQTSPDKQAVDQTQNWMPRQVIHEGVEFRPHKAQAEINEKRRSKLDTAVAGIMVLHEPALRRYKKAKKYLSALKPRDLEPGKRSEKTKLALRVFNKGPSITKEDAREQAYARFVRHGA